MASRKTSEQIKTEIVNLAKSNSNGITNEEIQTSLPGISTKDWIEVVNGLFREGSLQLFKGKDNRPLYKYKDAVLKAEVKDLELDERVVYRIIEDAGNKGIWIKDITSKSNLNPIILRKVLKKLETKKRIKVVNSVAARMKKVYMLYNLEPDTSMTGGVWYQDQDFDEDFVNTLNHACHKFLENKNEIAKKTGGGPIAVRNNSYVKASDVHKYITDSGVINVSLSISDIEKILYTFVLDCKAERTKNNQNDYLYKVASRFLAPPGIVKIPCGGCPVRSKCGKVGSITSKTCAYFDEWLEK